MVGMDAFLYSTGVRTETAVVILNLGKVCGGKRVAHGLVFRVCTAEKPIVGEKKLEEADQAGCQLHTAIGGISEQRAQFHSTVLAVLGIQIGDHVSAGIKIGVGSPDSGVETVIDHVAQFTAPPGALAVKFLAVRPDKLPGNRKVASL